MKPSKTQPNTNKDDFEYHRKGRDLLQRIAYENHANEESKPKPVFVPPPLAPPKITVQQLNLFLDI